MKKHCIAMLLAGIVAAFFAWLIGLPVLRLKSDYLAIATLGFADINRAVIQYDKLGPLTNGSNLLYGFTSFASFNLSLGGTTLHLETVMPFLFSGICIAIILLLINSTYGRAFKAIRDDEVAAEAMGINLARHKQFAFCLSSFFAGVGGALLGSHLSTIDPKMFNFLLTFNVLMFVVAGGLGSLTGSLLGATIVTILLEWLRAIEEPMRQIVENAGVEGAVILQKVREGKGDYGYNARTGEFEHFMATGVIDPAKVTRSALENAASVSAMVLTTESLVADKPDPKADAAMAAAAQGGGMGGMY